MNYNFNNIAGYNAEKEELALLCDVFNNRKEYAAKGAKLPKGIIFYGEAGNGKTLFAKVMASVCNLNTITIDLGNADAETAICKHIRKAFASAKKAKEPTMIFFDEVDKVMPNLREKYVTDRSKTILTQLLTLIDGMDSSGNVVFVATCNYYDSLPETLVRPGRIDKKIYVGKPNYQSRVEVLKMYIDKTNCNFEMSADELAKLSVGLSCAGLETLVNECVLQSDANGFVSAQLVKERILEIKNEDIPRKAATKDDLIVACSNVGAFVVSKMFDDGNCLLRSDTVYTTCNDFFNSLLSEFDDDYDDDCDDETDDEFDEDENDEDDYDYGEDYEDETSVGSYYSKQDFVNVICVLMSKVIVQQVVLNVNYDNNFNAISLIDSLLFYMSRCGLLGLDLVYLQSYDDSLEYSDEFRQRLREEFDAIKSFCYNKAKAIITANEAFIRKLIPVLVEREMLDRETLEPIIANLGGITYVK